MLLKSHKPQLILSVLITLFTLSLLFTLHIKAQVLFEDNFNDNNSSDWIEYASQGYWIVDNGEYIGSSTSIPGIQHQSYTIAGNYNWENYKFELDIKGVDGVGKSILFRVNSSGKAYVINLQSSYFGGGNRIILAKRYQVGTEQAAILKSVPFINYPNTYYKISVAVENINDNTLIKVYINNSILPNLEYLDTNAITSGLIGLEVWPGGYKIPTIGLKTTTVYDNIRVIPLDNTFINIDVPDLKQFYFQWGNLEYDFASSWYPGNPTISRWGCALTSASMILKHYGHDINPDALNEWLSVQKDGYSRNGGVMWTAISRLTEYRWWANHDWPILEFAYLNYSENTFKNEIQNNRPGILKLAKPIYDSLGNIKSYATHFLVGRGFNDTDILINDPGSNSHTTLAQANSYWGSTSKIGRFKKSETDLSYIVLHIDEGFEIEISDENGLIEGDEYYFTEEPFADPYNPELESGLPTLNTFYYPQPDSGEYTVRVKGDGVYRLDYYAYDEHGEVKLGNSFGTVEEGQSDEYTIEFDKYDLEGSFVPEISFESVISFWNDANEKGFISNNGLYTSINRLLENALKMSDKNTDASKSHLGEILLIIDEYDEQPISEKLLDNIKYQVEYLLSSIE